MRGQLRVLIILAVIVICLVAFVNLPLLSTLFEKLLSILLPILLGLSLAFMLNIPLRFLEKHWVRRFGSSRFGLRRFVCILLCLLFLAAVGALLLWIILPQLGKSVYSLLLRLPEYVEQVKGWWGALVTYVEAHDLPISLPALSTDSASVASAVDAYLEEHGHQLINLSVDLLRRAYLLVIDLLLSLILMLYFLAQKEKLCSQIKKLLHGIFSPQRVERILSLGTLCQKTFANFITGQLIEAVVISSLSYLGMLLFRMPHALLVSVIIGVTALIPIFGAFIGTGIGAVLILLDNPITAIWFVVFIIVLQQIETNLIYPKVVGKSVGLPGLWVLISVTVGSSFGLVGMLISVPLAAVLYCCLRQFVNDRVAKKEASPAEESAE